VDPDQHAAPAKKLAKRVLEPLQKQFDQRTNFVRPDGDGVSFIIFGPPGSGKTFFVETFAKVLGWPLIMLSPGHFIRNGLELIEAEASKIFEDLMHLDHAVVLFDECDELFRMRPKEEGESSGRNILSFATASMLPKLQDLHDAKRVIFFLGTNYLANVDDAIRRSGRFDGILFFDRPDSEARGKLIVRTVEEESSKHKISPAELKSAVDHTRGWMVRDLRAYAKSLVINGPKPTPSIDDYEKWLAEQGDIELEASGLEKKVKEGIRQRWSEFDHYAAGQKQRRSAKELEQRKAQDRQIQYELY
jgi:SpoVK/Ycf46/Vps4 family AAA+-type ATPase